jgi:hypothetical protein
MGWPDHPLFGQGVASASHQEKKNEMGLCRWRWSDHPQGPGCGCRGWPKPPQALGGGPATPNGTNPFRFFFLGGFRGGRSHPLAKKGVVRPPHFWARGWLQPPSISLFFKIFIKKKSKIKNGPKLCRFGQNGVVLGESKTT